MTITINMPEGAARLIGGVLLSWKTTVIGLASAAYGVFTLYANQDATLTAAIHDQKFIMALVVALLGVFANDASSSVSRKAEDADQKPPK